MVDEDEEEGDKDGERVEVSPNHELLVAWSNLARGLLSSVCCESIAG